MKRSLIILAFVVTAALSAATTVVIAHCGDTWVQLQESFGPPRVAAGHCLDTHGGGTGGSTINPTVTTKTVKYRIFFLDGTQLNDILVTKTGMNRDLGIIFEDCHRCFPLFGQPFFDGDNTTTFWNQITAPATTQPNGSCVIHHTLSERNRYGNNCRGNCTRSFDTPPEKAPSEESLPMLPISGCCDPMERLDCISGGGEWVQVNCSCVSPIVIDVVGNGFNLTNAANGVPFDIAGNGASQQVSWTSGDSDDAWLALDRNGNGRVDDGRELFGSSSPQSYVAGGEPKNGFRALAMFDKPEHGGNSDGQIDLRDTVFFKLKLWQDRNHNGVSELEELQSLSESEIRVFELRYRESKRQDEHGNWFRYRARVRDARGAQVGRWAWDVFLRTTKVSN